MNPTLLAGLLLGVLVSAWTFLMGITGWYRDPARIEELIRFQAPWQKPLPTAFAGVFGTWVTGLVASLLVAIGLRRKTLQ